MTADARRPRRGLVALLLAMLLWVTACDDGSAGGDGGPSGSTSAPVAGTAESEEAAPAPAEDPARTVRVVRPEEGTLTARRSASASIEPARTSRVTPSVSGTVQEILARPGTAVTQGQTVLRLDDESARLDVESARQGVRRAEIELRSARRASGESAGQADAGLESARVALQQAEEALADGRALHEAGAMSRSELRSLEAQREQAQAQWVSARDAAAQASRSGEEDLAALELSLASARTELQRAEQRLEDTRLAAPFDGEVVETFVEEGEMAAAGNPAFRIESVDEQEAVVELPPEDAQRLRRRGEVILRYDGLTYATVPVGLSRPAESPRTARLTLRLYDSETRIPNGARAELRYEVDLAEGLLLPSSAIHAEGDQTVVYRVEDGFALQTPVTVRAEAGGRAVVTGLEPAARVVSPRPLDVRDGTRVEVRTTDD